MQIITDFVAKMQLGEKVAPPSIKPEETKYFKYGAIRQSLDPSLKFDYEKSKA